METVHLMIRKFTSTDKSDFSELIRDKMKSRYAVYDEQFPTDDQGIEMVLSYFESSDEFFAIVHKEEHKIIGFISLNFVSLQIRNLGYCIHSRYQNRGYMTEAVAEIIRYAKDTLKIEKLISGTAQLNEPSIRILEKYKFMKTDESVLSFTKDETGNQITFTGYSFELKL